ncbi:MAG: hypothetical protein KDE48_11290 [Anaerolineales bacterium]|nr:hypothetical protein [Anaerolineales bacterium]
MSNNYPVVLVHGMFGFGPKELGDFTYWGSAFKVATHLARFEASVGPVSSAHDRACELAAQIKGTPVDYGLEHSVEAGHARFGLNYSGKGFVPKWDENNPIHLVGHSLGAPTIRCLQHLLAHDFWGWGSSERWVASITTLSGVNNGSTATHYFGADEQTGLLPKDTELTPVLRFLEVLTAVTGGYKDSLYDFDLGHWGFVRKGGEDLITYLQRVGKSKFFWGRDNAVYEAGLHGAYAGNGIWATYPNSYYFAYITEQTYKGWFSGRYYPEPFMNPAMLATSTYIGQKVFTQPPIPVAKFNSADWWENDGLVPTYSQGNPHTNGNHPVGSEFSSETPTTLFEPGKWYYAWERGKDHGDICVTPQLNQRGWQRRFYTNLFQRLADLD